MKKITFIAATLIYFSGYLFGQTFTLITEGDIVNSGGSGNGCSWADYDNDGDLDLFVTNSFGGNFLYVNNIDGTFPRITEGIIVAEVRRARDVSWGDYDNDGYLDVFVSSMEKNALYLNNGNGTFKNITESPIVADTVHTYGGNWGDYDGDGYLDLFAGNHVHGGTYSNSLFHNNGDGSFTRLTEGVVATDSAYAHASNWVDYDNDGNLDLFIANQDDPDGIDNFLYANNGDGTFTKITEGPVVTDKGLSRGGSWGDYDNDGDLDLFVANRGGENNFLYANNGDGTFTKVIDGPIVSDGGNSTGSSWGDYDNDGDLDLVVMNKNDENSFLYENNGDGGFVKITEGEIVSTGGNSRGCSWGDYDNDGDLDLFVVNYKQNDFLFANNGNNNSWINIKCNGTVSNTAAIGAKVRIKATINGRSVWQLNEISSQSGGGWGGQNSLNAEFGLGDATVVDSVRIEWPSGIIDEFTNLDVNQFIEVTEGEGFVVVAIKEARLQVPQQFELHQNYPNPFNPTTTIEFSLPHSSYVTLTVHNVLGQEVEVLLSRHLSAGNHKVTLDAKTFVSGVYYYRMEAGTFADTRKLLFLK